MLIDDEDPRFSKVQPMQKRFCWEYVTDWNGARAARAAGYAAKNSGVTAAQLLQKPHVREYIKHVQEKAGMLAGISAVRNLKELANVAYSTMADMHNTWTELKDFEALTPEQRAAIETIDTKIINRLDKAGKPIKETFVRIKLYNKLTAIEQINKMLGYNAPTKVDATSNGATIQPAAQLTQEQINKLIEKL